MAASPVDEAADQPVSVRSATDAGSQDVGRSLWRRAIVGLVGVALVASGVRRHTVGGTAAVLAGGWLTHRAVSGGPRTAESTASRPAGDGGPRGAGAGDHRVTVTRSITVGRPLEEVRAFASDRETVSRLLGATVEVRPVGGDSHAWRASSPIGWLLAWETRLEEGPPDAALRWRVVEGRAPFDEASLTLRPASGDRGTVVTLRLSVEPPGGSVGTAVLGRLEPLTGALLERPLDRFKSLLETGEIPSLERNPSARGVGDRL